MSSAATTNQQQPPPAPPREEDDPPVSPALEGPHPQQPHEAAAGGGGGGGGENIMAPPPHSSSQHDPSSSSSSHDHQQALTQQQQQQQLQLQQQQLQQQAAAMGFNPAAGRRVTIGGIQGSAGNAGGGNAFDRRGSLASASGFNMDDFFGTRRGSLGFDMGMEAFFGGGGGPGGRRGSMDSTTAVLDQAIFDLQSKRFSMAMGAGGGGGTGAGGVAPPPDFGAPQTSLAGMGSMGSLGGLGPGYNPPSFAVPPVLPPSSAGSIAARQQQLQEQQRDLERRQKELEVARQQLIASMQERTYAHTAAAAAAAGAGAGGPSQTQQPQHPFGPYPTSGSMGWGHPGAAGGGYRRSSLDLSGRGGLDYSHRGGGPSMIDLPHRGTMDFSARGVPLDHSQRSGLGVGHPLDHSHRSSASSSAASQWWVCQVCNAKAFASHEEAMAHEAVCQDVPRVGGGRRNDSLAFSEASQNAANLHRESIGTMGTMDSSSHSYEPVYSNGPFADMEHPMPLAMPSDKDWLTPLHCFVRRHCVEVFTASEYDVATPSKGKRKPITVGQVGIRCPHCHANDPDAHAKARERGSVYFPTTIASIYNATMNLLQRHLHSCTSVPEHIMRRYETLKADDARSGTSKKYWIQSAHSLGLVDTPMGIRYSALVQPPQPQALTGGPHDAEMYARRNSNDFFSSSSNAGIKEVSMSERKVPASPHSSRAMAGHHDGDGMLAGGGGMDYLHAAGPLVSVNDKPYSTSFSYHLLSQMQPCSFTEADRLGKRKGLPQGFPGLACRHCFGGYGSGRFFPSSIKTLSDTSKTLNVLHNHMMRCRKCPAEVRELLEKLRGSHDDERAKMKFGSQKAFFARIWDRLHGKDPHSMDTSHGSSPRPKGKRKAPPPSQQPQQHHPHMGHQPFPMSDDSMHRSRRGSATGSLDSMVAAAAAASELPPLSKASTGALDALVQASDVKRQKAR